MDDRQLSLQRLGMRLLRASHRLNGAFWCGKRVHVSVNLPLEGGHRANTPFPRPRWRPVFGRWRVRALAPLNCSRLEVRRRNEDKVALQRRQVALAFALALPVFVLSMVLEDLGTFGRSTSV